MTRVDILVKKGSEELLGLDFYGLSGGVWVEDEAEGVRIRCYPPDPARFLAFLRASPLPTLHVAAVEEREQDYVALVRRHFTPVNVAGVTILPPWRTPRAKGLTIFIEPGMAFGTGRHESTRLMIRMMGRTTLGAKRVLDLGAGSGILSVYAALLAASLVVAVDHDPLAVEAARKARDLNATPEVLLACADIEAVCGVFDVVLANLDFATFEKHADRVSRLVAPGGSLLLSGIEAQYNRGLPPLFRGLEIVGRHRMGDWRAFMFRAPAI